MECVWSVLLSFSGKMRIANNETTYVYKSSIYMFLLLAASDSRKLVEEIIYLIIGIFFILSHIPRKWNIGLFIYLKRTINIVEILKYQLA